MENINISVLGSTGSIGTQTLAVARDYKEISIKAITANSNVSLIEKQAREFKPSLAVMADEEKAKDLRKSFCLISYNCGYRHCQTISWRGRGLPGFSAKRVMTLSFSGSKIESWPYFPSARALLCSPRQNR